MALGLVTLGFMALGFFVWGGRAQLREESRGSRKQSQGWQKGGGSSGDGGAHAPKGMMWTTNCTFFLDFGGNFRVGKANLYQKLAMRYSLG